MKPKIKDIKINGKTIHTIEPMKVKGFTDRFYFEDYVSRVYGTAEIGQMCPCCNKDVLSNVIAVDSESYNKHCVIKCYECGNTFLANYNI